MSLRGPIKHKRKKQIHSDNGFRCYYCGEKSKNLTLDHKLPLALGGANGNSNLVSCCNECNQKKGCLSIEDFRGISNLKNTGGLFYGERK